MNNIKPPTFDSEHMKDEDADTSLLAHEEVLPTA
jgi:hypothetical protein